LEGCSISNLGLFNLFSRSDSKADHGFVSAKGIKGIRKVIPVNGSLRGLKFLNISDCLLIDDYGIQEISEKAHALQELEIRDLKRITLQGLNIMLNGLTELKKLDLRGILNLQGYLDGNGLDEINISIQGLESLLNVKYLQILVVLVSGRQTRGFGGILADVILNNQSLQELVLVKDNSLGMYSLEDLDIDWDPCLFPHLKITMVSDETRRFA
jgi:hypothetical protein